MAEMNLSGFGDKIAFGPTKIAYAVQGITSSLNVLHLLLEGSFCKVINPICSALGICYHSLE